MNRLTSANGPFGALSYSYDQVGNRLSAVVNGTATSYSYGPYNKLLSAGSTTYSYDNNGNMISKTSGSNSWAYKYDYQNRLNQVLLNGLSVFQATYDGDGRRVQTVAGTDTTIYHYQAGSWDPIYVKGLTSGTITDVLFARSLRIGKVRGGISYFYHLDLLGSVRLVTKTGNVQSFSTKYLPFGSTYATSGSERFQYTGKLLDVQTGLYYFGYRYFESQSGRFTTIDIQGPDYRSPQSLNRYPYALNNPNRYVDPDGRLVLAAQLMMEEGLSQSEAVAAARAILAQKTAKPTMMQQGSSTPTPSTPARGPPNSIVMKKLMQMEMMQLQYAAGTSGSATTTTPPDYVVGQTTQSGTSTSGPTTTTTTSSSKTQAIGLIVVGAAIVIAVVAVAVFAPEVLVVSPTFFEAAFVFGLALLGEGIVEYTSG